LFLDFQKELKDKLVKANNTTSIAPPPPVLQLEKNKFTNGPISPLSALPIHSTSRANSPGHQTISSTSDLATCNSDSTIQQYKSYNNSMPQTSSTQTVLQYSSISKSGPSKMSNTHSQKNSQHNSQSYQCSSTSYSRNPYYRNSDQRGSSHHSIYSRQYSYRKSESEKEKMEELRHMVSEKNKRWFDVPHSKGIFNNSFDPSGILFYGLILFYFRESKTITFKSFIGE
jgi:hypothetical protein